MALNYSMPVDVLNQEETENMVPLLVYLVIIMLTGIPGNILVCIIYRRNAGKSTYQFFVTCLAVADCTTCCIAPFVINKIVHHYTFRGNWLCKFTIFLQCWPTFVSAGILCVIDIDRYRMICKPHDRQITNKIAKQICTILGFLTAVLASPILILYGVREIPIHPYNLTGTECGGLPEYDGTIYFNLFNGFLGILFITSLTIIVVFYILIGKQIFNRYHAKQCNSKTSTKITLNGRPEVSVVGNESNEQNASSNRKENEYMSGASVEINDSGEQTAETSFTITDTKMDQVNQKVYRDNRRATDYPKASRVQNKKDFKAKRSVFIMFLISLMFIISFLPTLIVRIIGALNGKDLIYTMSDEARTAFKFFRKSYFINAAVNPLIYCACAPKFRKDVKALLFGRTRHSRH